MIIISNWILQFGQKCPINGCNKRSEQLIANIIYSELFPFTHEQIFVFITRCEQNNNFALKMITTA